MEPCLQQLLSDCSYLPLQWTLLQKGLVRAELLNLWLARPETNAELREALISAGVASQTGNFQILRERVRQLAERQCAEFAYGSPAWMPMPIAASRQVSESRPGHAVQVRTVAAKRRRQEPRGVQIQGSQFLRGAQKQMLSEEWGRRHTSDIERGWSVYE